MEGEWRRACAMVWQGSDDQPQVSMSIPSGESVSVSTKESTEGGKKKARRDVWKGVDVYDASAI